jgi:hypothetical protein
MSNNNDIKTMNTGVPNIKADSPEVKEVVDFADAVNTCRLNATNSLRQL